MSSRVTDGRVTKSRPTVRMSEAAKRSAVSRGLSKSARTKPALLYPDVGVFTVDDMFNGMTKGDTVMFIHDNQQKLANSLFNAESLPNENAYKLMKKFIVEEPANFEALTTLDSAALTTTMFLEEITPNEVKVMTGSFDDQTPIFTDPHASMLLQKLKDSKHIIPGSPDGFVATSVYFHLQDKKLKETESRGGNRRRRSRARKSSAHKSKTRRN
jgi:hypothetical protein